MESGINKFENRAPKFRDAYEEVAHVVTDKYDISKNRTINLGEGEALDIEPLKIDNSPAVKLRFVSYEKLAGSEYSFIIAVLLRTHNLKVLFPNNVNLDPFHAIHRINTARNAANAIVSFSSNS